MISKPSKSAKKREKLELQELGEALISLTATQLARLDLDERLFDAITLARSISSHGALRRQKQLIGKLMRGVDAEPIRSALDAIGSSDRLQKRVFREAERWRDRITGTDPAALDAFFDYLGHDSKPLLEHLQALRGASHERARKHAQKQVFREIHREVASKVLNDNACI